jgi:hypothetical protein
LFCYRQRIIDFDAEISGGAFYLGVAEQELHGSEITSAPVDQGRLSSPKRVGAEKVRVQSNAADPFRDEPGVLARCHALALAAPPCE